jgi:general secretion pathway protein B
VSYILDALRKSEQQRQHGVAPRLLTVHATSGANTQPAFLKYGFIAAVLIGTGIVVGGLHPWQQAQRLSATESTPTKMLESSPPQSLPAPLPVLPETTRESEQEKPVQEALVAVEKPAPAPEVAAPVKQVMDLLPKTPVQTSKLPPKPAAAIPKKKATPVRETTTAPALEKAVPPFQEKSADAAPADTAQEQKVVSMAELPPAIQQEIPAMSIPVHTYSTTPKERVVGINDRLLQEGDYLAPGLRLEQIAPDGVIFSYKNYLFRHGL